MRTTLLLLSLLLLAPRLAAQDEGLPIVELRFVSGAFVPVGSLREGFHDGILYGMQGALEFRRTWHVTGSFTVAPNHARFGALSAAATIVQYDAGVEWSAARDSAGGWRLQPFAGAGVGVRGWEYATRDLTDQMCAVGFVAAGAELRRQRFALRVEARDNVTCFRPARPADRTAMRSDLWLAGGVTLHFQ